VAFVQFQIASTVYGMPESQRSLADVEAAAAGLEEAIESLDVVGQHPQTPYPKNLVEGRANMGRNTMRKQLERSIQAQKEYEERNAEKLQHALEQRQAELKKREEERQTAEAAERERKRLIAEERQKIAERDRILAEQRAEEDRAREAAEMTTDSETGERVKRKKKPRGGKRKKKEGDESSGDDSAMEGTRRSRRKDRKSAGDSDEDENKPKKKRRLQKKISKKDTAKYKSSEVVVDSDSEGGNGATEAAKEMDRDLSDEDRPAYRDTMDVDPAEGSDDEEVATVPVARKNRTRRIESDDEDEDAPAIDNESPATANGDEVDTPMNDRAEASEDE
jgi:RNA polymerase-associated protein CTR9